MLYQITCNIQGKYETAYKPLVMAGPAYDESTHLIVTVNDPKPFLVDSPHATLQLHVRIRNFDGLLYQSRKTSSCLDHERHRKDFYSIAFSFTPKKTNNSKDLVRGNDFDHLIRDQLPSGLATRLQYRLQNCENADRPVNKL